MTKKQCDDYMLIRARVGLKLDIYAAVDAAAASLVSFAFLGRAYYRVRMAAMEGGSIRVVSCTSINLAIEEVVFSSLPSVA